MDCAEGACHTASLNPPSPLITLPPPLPLSSAITALCCYITLPPLPSPHSRFSDFPSPPPPSSLPHPPPLFLTPSTVTSTVTLLPPTTVTSPGLGYLHVTPAVFHLTTPGTSEEGGCHSSALREYFISTHRCVCLY